MLVSGWCAIYSLHCPCFRTVVELDLGLLDDASQNFSRVLEDKESLLMFPIAALGSGMCLLSLAKRHVSDGKFGAALQCLKTGIRRCDSLGISVASVSKLRGDMYSFGAVIPPDLFADEKKFRSTLSEADAVALKQSFVAKGVEQYRSAEGLVMGTDSEETKILKACIMTDIGSNILSQAELLSERDGKGLDLPSVEADLLYESSSIEFRRALACYPEHAPAWCGLGCALVKSDVLQAQHAFCRAVELDIVFPEAYSNLAFLYTMNNSLASSENVTDSLTQVADTPMMWINRALLLERKAFVGEANYTQSESLIAQAADAYRAALQVAALDSAKAGLSMTCRVASNDEMHAREEVDNLLCEYHGVNGGVNLPAKFFHGVSLIESATASPTGHREELIEAGRLKVREALTELQASNDNPVAQSIDFASFDSLLDRKSVRGLLKSEDNGVGAFSLERRLLYDPGNGNMWLKLAKELMMSTLSVDNLEPAFIAVRKATTILMQQLADTSNKKTFSVVEANQLSDALSLEFYLEHILANEGEAVAMNSVNLQRSFIINPGNSFAREIVSKSS
jgi:hypothetical protein